jgi:methyl acetate hydrolase
MDDARRFLLVVVLLSAALTAAAQSGRDAPTNGRVTVDRVLADAVARRDIPGVVAMAATPSRILYTGAFGAADASSGRALTFDSIFRIASMTKPITSVAAMQFVEQGRLALDDPASKYLPELADLKVFASFDAHTGAYALRPATRTLTVRHLLTHTSGLGYNFTSAIVRDFKARDGEEYVAGPLLFEPGERWLYGTSTDWVGRLVEVLSGQPLEVYFRTHIFEPLGMHDTFYNVPADREPRLVKVHRRQADGTFGLDAVQPPLTVARPIGGGGLASTASDYMRFLQMLLNGGSLDGARVLSPETVALMGRNHIGRLGVPAVKTTLPERSSDFTFVQDGRDKWGLGFLIAAPTAPGKRSSGSLSWGGINNTYFWVDSTRGIGGVILMQFLPFADSRALAVYDAFERAIYRLGSRS